MFVFKNAVEFIIIGFKPTFAGNSDNFLVFPKEKSRRF